MTTESTPRVGVRTRRLTDNRLRYVKQLGADDVFVDPLIDDSIDDPYFSKSTGDEPEGLVFHEERPPSVSALTGVRERVEAKGLRLAGIHTVPPTLYDDIVFGRDGAPEQVEWYRDLIRNAGRASVPVVGYQWCPGGVYRTADAKRIRGGAEATAYDHAAFDGDANDVDVTEAEMWDNYERFLEEVLPVAEEAGVRLALHPDDPPNFPQLEGVPRLFRDRESLARGMDLVPSDNHGLKLCLGCFSEMGEDVPDVVREFGERDQIVFVHFRDVVGTVPSFHETFVDAGNFDPHAVARTLVDVGFAGAIIPDHVPAVEGDTEWGHRARAFTIGYLKALAEL